MQCVYLLQEIDFDGVTPTGLYKIGKTTRDVEKRKREYQAGNARRVDILHTIQVDDAQAIETKLHRHLVSYRLNHGDGDEWFDFGNIDIYDIIDFVDEYDETPVYVDPIYSTEYSYEASYDSYSYHGNSSDDFSNLVVGLLICLGLLFGGVILSQSSQATSARIEIPTSVGYAAANLRSVPKTGDDFIIGQVSQGERLTAHQVSPDGQWRRVKLLDGRTGWVANNLVK